MDSLPLFTIPKWLPYTIPPELWAIIFSWKWRLEMKDILIEFLSLEKVYCKKSPAPEFCPFSNMNKIRGNMWTYKLKEYSLMKNKNKKRIIVNPRCGIKLINIHPNHGLIIGAQLRHTRRRWWGLPVLTHHALAQEWTTILFRKGNKGLYKHITEDLGIDCLPHIPCYKMLSLVRTV
jgi:hypothetical protein